MIICWVFLISRWSLIWQILGTLLSRSFSARERYLVGVERKKLKMQKENLTRLLPLFENPKYMRAYMSWLDGR